MNTLFSKRLLPALTIVLSSFILFHSSQVSADFPAGSWTHIERQSPATDINSIFSDSDGVIWAGAGSVFHTFSDNHWKKFDYSGYGLSNHSPFAMDSAGRLYFIDNNELVIWANGVLKRYGDVKIGYPAIGTFSSDGSLYMRSYSTTAGGIFRFDGSAVTRLSEERTRSIAVDKDGTLWATVLDSATELMKLKVLKNGEWLDKSDEVGYLYPVTTNEMTVQIAPDGAVWACNYSKFGVFRNGEWSFHEGGGTPVFMHFDTKGRVWGYGGGKIYLLNTSTDKWSVIMTMSHAIAASPDFMTEMPDGSIITFDAQNLYKYNGTVFKQIESYTDLADNLVTTLEYTETGDLILGHGRRDVTVPERASIGVSMRIDGEWVYGREFDKVEFMNVFQLKRTPDMEVMAYTDGGFKWYGYTGWTKVDSLYVGNQTDMTWNDEIMWITTTRGLIEWTEGPDFDFYFPMDSEMAYTLKNITIDTDNLLYMQTEKGDIVTFDGNEWNTIFDEDRDTVDFCVDNEGTLWAARLWSLSRWNSIAEVWVDVEPLDTGRVIELDPEGRVWVGSNGKTGYVEDGVFHAIPELSGIACDAIAFSLDGRVAVNAFDFNREKFYGVYEFSISTGVDEHVGKPLEFITSSCFPNPFNPSTTIQFDLPEASNVVVDVFSITGQRIARIADGYYLSGRTSIVWDGSNSLSAVAAGLYFYRIRAGKYIATGKMMLVK